MHLLPRLGGGGGGAVGKGSPFLPRILIPAISFNYSRAEAHAWKSQPNRRLCQDLDHSGGRLQRWSALGQRRYWLLSSYFRSTTATYQRRLFSTSNEVDGSTPTITAQALRWSWSEGPLEPALLDETIGEYFNQIACRYGDRPAVISHHQDITLSFSRLHELSTTLASRLHNKLSVQQGDRVCVQLGNTIEHVVTAFALFILGAVLVPLNPGSNAGQVINALSHIEARHLIVGRVGRQAHGREKSNWEVVRMVLEAKDSGELGTLKNIVVVNNDDVKSSAFGVTFRQTNQEFDGADAASSTVPFESLTNNSASNRLASFPLATNPRATINIQFTSGTTSSPKAACLSHRNIVNNGKSIGDRLGLGPTDIICCPPPLMHCFGSVLGLMATITHGAAIVFPAEAFDAEASITAVEKYGCTGLHGVPTMFSAELDLLANESPEDSQSRFTNLRTGIAAGSTVPAELMARLYTKLGLTELCNCYGMTETSPVSCMTRPDDTLRRRLETVGTPLPHVKVKVVNPSNRELIMPIGQRGELAVCGYLLMTEYWNDKARTDDDLLEQTGRDPNMNDVPTTTERWMYTGDEAVVDAEGYVTITGRIKDLIIRGGENIHPPEIENVMFSHSAVSDCSVVGIPDDRYGEIVVAFIILRHQHRSVVNQSGPELSQGHSYLSTIDSSQLKEELREWVRARLSNHLVPKHVFWIDEFPKTASGKVQKYKLRELAIEQVGQLVG